MNFGNPVSAYGEQPDIDCVAGVRNGSAGTAIPHNTKRGENHTNTYCDPEDLAKFGTMDEEILQLWNIFMGYCGSIFQEGILIAGEKSLIVLAVAAAVQ